MTEEQSIEALRREIETERNRLVESVSVLRAEIARKKQLEVGLPVIAATAVAGFVLAGGVRATIRFLIARERREEAASRGVSGWFFRR